MKNKTILLIALTILTMIVVYFVTSKKDMNLVGPSLIQQTPTSTPMPTPNIPKTFQFDSSTDLKMELEKVNPQILDSDFE